MKIRRLRMQNYRRHADTEIEFPDGVFAIVGRNGSGKSTILEGIGMALYGTLAARTNKDLLRFDRAPPGDAVRIELDAEVAGQAWSIVRELRGKNLTNYASLTVDGQTIVPAQSGSADAVTQEVISRIGLDRDAFFTTVFSQQKDLGRLTDQTPAQRKKLILGMLGIDHLDHAIQKARQRRTTAETRLQALRETLPDVEALKQERDAQATAIQAQQGALNQAEKAWTAAQQALAKAETSSRRLRDAHEARTKISNELRLARASAERAAERLAQAQVDASKAAAASRRLAEIGDAAARLAEARKHHAEAQARAELRQAWEREKARVEALPAVEVPAFSEESLQHQQQAQQEISAQREQAQSRLHEVRAEVRQLDKRLQEIDDLEGASACPVCEQPLNGHLPGLHASMHERLVQLRTDGEAIKAQLDTMNGRLQTITGELATLQQTAAKHAAAKQQAEAQAAEIARFQAKPEPPIVDVAPFQEAVEVAIQLAEEQRSLQQIKAPDLAALEAAAKESRRLVAGHEAALRDMPDVTDQVAQAVRTEAQARTDERAAERAVTAAGHQLELVGQRLQQIDTQLATAEDQAAKAKATAEELEHWQVLVGARGGGLLDRFRTHLIGRIRPAVAHEAGRLLSRFTGGRYDEILIDDDYQVYVTDAGTAYDISRFSGGESDLVHLALRLAVSRLLLERSQGAEIRFLALDEVFGSLDDERRGLVLGAMQELGGLYAQVLIVTHQESLRDALDHTVIVEEVDGQAVVRMHND